MARLDDLPADQKAVLQLVLRQGRSYEDIAGLLKISPEAVRERALNALDALGPEDTPGLPEDRQDEVGDHLLGQQTASRSAATREFLESSAAGRAWARVVSGEVRGAGMGAGLPDIPEERSDRAEADDDATADRAGAGAHGPRSSRTGGLVLLVGVLALVVVGVVVGVLALNGTIGGDDKKAAKPAATTQTAGGGQTQVESQVNLTPATKDSKALGVANVVKQDNQRAIAVIGQDLPASPRYVLWLYNSPSDSRFLGFFPPVEGKGENKGRLQGLVAAPEDMSKYKQIVVTRERGDQPKRPGTIVLRGPIGR